MDRGSRVISREMPHLIAIDGPGGVGKTTVASALARHFDVPHLDTGAFYRGATLAVLRSGIDLDVDGEHTRRLVVDVVAGADLQYCGGNLMLDGEDVSDQIRSAAVTRRVSQVSAIPEVRALLVDHQRAWVKRHGGSAVVEGRDIGTVVFRDADAKVFLTARPEVRAARRAGDARGDTGGTVESVAADLARRDQADSTREVSPLRAAEDAVVIDTSELDVGQVVARAVAVVEEATATALAEPGV